MSYGRFYLLIGIIAAVFFLQSKLDASPSAVYPSMITSKKPVSQGIASWYSKKSPRINKRTANNEIFDDQAMTCAMWGVKFNQYVRVTNKANGRSIIVRVNDRGPKQRLVRQGRIIDLTEAAFSKIASPRKGTIDIQLEFL
ncbi:MAG: septal ring lytic transglycosylase RlpA family lipoprotein [Candidatus Omnitrophica bacterium]|nr:septal ring lytic transglycosylase RlpA family lipoprotein [Candidatus Omnitrophota bacterium]